MRLCIPNYNIVFRPFCYAACDSAIRAIAVASALR